MCISSTKVCARSLKSFRSGEGAVGGAELVGTFAPIVNELAGPRAGKSRIGAAADVGGAIGEAAMRTLEHDAVVGGVVPELGPKEGLGGLAVLDPVDEVGDDVVGGRGSGEVLAELPSTGAGDTADSAVSHTRDTEETEEVVHLVIGEAELAGELEIVALSVATRSDGVSHAMIHHELLAGIAEATEPGAEGRGVTVKVVLALTKGDVSSGEGGNVEVGVVEDGATEPITGDTLWRAREQAKLEGIDLGTGEERRVDESTFGTIKRFEDILDCLDLLGGQAASGDGRRADRDLVGVEFALSGILQNAVGNTIEDLIALLENVTLDSDPVVLSEESVVAGGASELEEASRPALKVVEVIGGGTSDDTVKVIGVPLSGLDTLSTTCGAADVVGIVGRLVVESIDGLFANLDSSVTGTVRPVDDLLVAAEGPAAVKGAAVVASVVTDRGEAEAADVLHVNVVDAAVETAVVGVHGAAIPIAGLAVG